MIFQTLNQISSSHNHCNNIQLHSKSTHLLIEDLPEESDDVVVGVPLTGVVQVVAPLNDQSLQGEPTLQVLVQELRHLLPRAVCPL